MVFYSPLFAPPYGCRRSTSIATILNAISLAIAVCFPPIAHARFVMYCIYNHQILDYCVFSQLVHISILLFHLEVLHHLFPLHHPPLRPPLHHHPLRPQPRFLCVCVRVCACVCALVTSIQNITSKGLGGMFPFLFFFFLLEGGQKFARMHAS
jgi:hypothetical protein